MKPALARQALWAFRQDLRQLALHRAGLRVLGVVADTAFWVLLALRLRAFLRATVGFGFGIGLWLRLFFHIDIWSDDIGGGLRLPHPFNIVIGEGARIGRDCVILHNVTVQRGQVVIGDKCVLAVGVVVATGASVGSGSIVGALSVVNGALPPDVVAAGSPATVLRTVSESERIADLD